MSRWSVTSKQDPERFIHWVDGTWTADEETSYWLKKPGMHYDLAAPACPHPILDNEIDICWAAYDFIPDAVADGDVPPHRPVPSGGPGIIY